eukprot:TRINITY_DN2027_c0_g1_i3.p1 TRINITY_DN2027_c0_g1~~TRINITY_DN2027_c0_g1_i3.p1  ORF type:complete len:564 (+),score=171.25 TRINITY_DN2027_c0_g1_i3:52-1743(+)
MSKVFGVPLETLVASDKKKHHHIQVPYVLQQAVRLIVRNGIDNEGIFRISGNKEKVASYVEAINKGVELDFVKDRANPNDVASLLKQFLRELPDPLLTFSKYNQWIKSYETSDLDEQRDTIINLIKGLPEANQATLRLIIPFMGRIAMNSSINKMDSGNLSKTIGPNLLWKEGGGDSIDYLVNSSKINDLVQYMVDNYRLLFPESVGFDYNSEYASFEAKLFGHGRSVQCLAAGFKDLHVWSADSNGAIRIWDTTTHRMVKEMDPGQGRLFTMSKIGDRIWTASQKSVKVWNAEDFSLVKEISGFGYCVAQVENSVWVGSEGKILIFNLKSLELEREIETDREVVMSLIVDDSGKYVWGGTTSRKAPIAVWESESGRLFKEISDGHKKKVNSFVKHGQHIWSAADDFICVWDAQSMGLVKKMEAHEGAVYGLTVFGDLLWSCSWDTTIRIWDAHTMETVCELRDYHSDCVSAVVSVQLENAKPQAWSGSWDKSICIFNTSLIFKTKPVNGHHRVNPDGNAEKLTKDEISLKTTQLTEKSRDLQQRKLLLDERKKRYFKLKNSS